MYVMDQTELPVSALPMAEFRAHLRLGTGFAEDSLQDVVLESFLRAALAAVEVRCSKVLIARVVTWRLHEWRNQQSEVLPLAPVRAVEAVRLLDGEGVPSEVAASSYRLEMDAHFPMLRATGACLPAPVLGGQVEIVASVGFAAQWSGVPADLQQAVMMLAAHYYEYRNETTLDTGCMPFGVSSLIARYRPVRIGMEGAR
ncbi:head-tail connector protein [Cognatishimia activa]|uniref:Phage gp6-like head-tail connector protein n=1 Tax=Cognatishimia activa TaxID=1715691 RepID=A0A0N7MC13_9RHOB|nr:head-tail connector protein [Cognatishimia activa]MEE2945550.1 head-tail connector protein [Pseudomonadota bacterium]CUJ38570.1 Phage gp6-like head-tail connector protein [Cognatishimia activa]CUK26928.1 Phage gp6-like head-tail connector protein [Cognatishimia activa]